MHIKKINLTTSNKPLKSLIVSTLALDITERLKLVRKHMEPYSLSEEITQVEDYIIQILELKKEKNAVILGHNYMSPEIYYGLSDFSGDSFSLSQQAKNTNADIIIFNGVYFMAETAKILNPDRKVLIAELKAGCSLSESINANDIKKLKAEYPNVPVVTYINCSAEVKAEADIICTSSNALKVVNSLDSQKVIMVPDEYLAKNVQKETNKEIISWKGKCMVHELFTPEDIDLNKEVFPNAMVIAHPECHEEVTNKADFVGSTSQIEKYVEELKPEKIILFTECSMGDNLKAKLPSVEFVSTCQTCPHMKKITLKKILDCLKEEKYEVTVPKLISDRAYQSLEKMLQIGN